MARAEKYRNGYSRAASRRREILVLLTFLFFYLFSSACSGQDRRIEVNNIVDRLYETRKQATTQELKNAIDNVLNSLRAYQELGTVNSNLSDIEIYVRGLRPDLHEGTTRFQVAVEGRVNIRKEPSIKSERVGTLEAADTVEVIGSTGSWYHVVTPDGRRGYVYEELLEPVEIVPVVTPESQKEHAESAHEQQEAPSENAKLTPLLRGNLASFTLKKSDDLSQAVEELASGVERENPAFTQPAYQCREDLELCRNRGLGWLDCELVMIVCLASIFMRG